MSERPIQWIETGVTTERSFIRIRPPLDEEQTRILANQALRFVLREPEHDEPYSELAFRTILSVSSTEKELRNNVAVICDILRDTNPKVYSES